VVPEDRERIGQIQGREEGVSFRRYVVSRGRHDLNHIEQIRALLMG
jgi:hypothetical protein